MELYIPFNSNDFNSVFATLSISPRFFYTKRNYSYKRATSTILNQREDVLIGFSMPIFFRGNDKENGYTIYIKLDLEERYINLIPKDYYNIPNCKIYTINKTIFLANNFQLVFRDDNERQDILSKSLKSIETKYASIAKQQSIIFGKKKIFDISQIQNQYAEYGGSINDDNFRIERLINKQLGFITCFAIGVTKNLGENSYNLPFLIKELNNFFSLFINSISSIDNREEKRQLIGVLEKIYNQIDKANSLDEILFFKMKGGTTEEFAKLQNIFYEDHSLYSLILEGLINSKIDDLPIQLQIELTKRQINYNYNKKYPSNYLSRITENIQTLKNRISRIIENEYSSKELIYADLPSIVNVYGKEVVLKFPFHIDKNEVTYLSAIFNFFSKNDFLLTPDSLFADREEILTLLGKHFSESINNFKGSKERDYIYMLLNSFKSLRTTFEYNDTNLISLKSIALIFTFGRDLNKYLDAINQYKITLQEIPLSVWGIIYGHASIPKTLTDDLLKSQVNSNILMECFKNLIADNFTDTFIVPVAIVQKIELKNVDWVATVEEVSEARVEYKAITSLSFREILNDRLKEFPGWVRANKLFNKRDDIVIILVEWSNTINRLIQNHQNREIEGIKDVLMMNAKDELLIIKKKTKVKGLGDEKIKQVLNFLFS